MNHFKSISVLFTIFLLSLCINSCTQHKDDNPVKHYSESIFAWADSLCISSQYSQKGISFIDSVYSTFRVTSIADKYRYYLFRAKLQELQLKDKVSTETALTYADSMISVIEDNGKTKVMSQEYANALRLKGTYCLALKYYNEAAKAISMCKFISQQNGDSCTVGENTASLGNIAYGQSKYLQAADYFKEAIRLFSYCKNSNDQFYLTQAFLDNLALSYDRAHFTDSAFKYFKIAESYILQNKQLFTKDPKFPFEALRVVYDNIAGLMKKKKEYDSAKNYLGKELLINQEYLHDSIQIAACKIALAGIHMETSETDKALVLLNEVKSKLYSIPLTDRFLWFDYMKKIAAIRSDIKQELSFAKQYYSIKDSLTEERKGVLNIDPLIEFDKLEKKNKIDILEKNNELQRTYIVASVFIVLLFVALVLAIYLSLRRSRKMVVITNNLNNELVAREQQLKQLMIEQERIKEKERQDELFLQELRFQMEYNEGIAAQRGKISDDMHDQLSSSLAALRFYTEDLQNREDNAYTKELLTTIVAEVSSIYEDARRYMHNLKSNAEGNQYNLVAFLTEISQKFAEKKLFAINFSIDKEKINAILTSYQHNHLYHVVRESISNIIKHAHATEVNININFENDKCHFTIEDNGRGFNEATINYGIGLKSIESRIKELNGALEIHSGSSGTILKGTFPVFT